MTRAWTHFYDDTDGIRTAFSNAWGAVAARFAGRPEVAGYDLLNEPDTSEPAATLTPKYEALLRETGSAIRTAEADAPVPHLLFVEPTLPAGHRDNGIVVPDPARVGIGTDAVVGSVHNYAESIDNGLGLTIEGMNGVILGFTAEMGVPSWGGEYGFWDTEPSTLEKAGRYAADEDRLLLGGAWWQWRQSCGDPHAVQWVDGEVRAPTEDQVHLNTLACPGNTDSEPTEAFLKILGRGYPRAAPGRLTTVESDPASGRLDIAGKAEDGDVGKTLVVWTPTGKDRAITVEHLDEPTVQEVEGGRIISAVVAAPGAYRLTIA